MNNRHQPENTPHDNGVFFWARHHVEMFKDSLLRFLNLVNHFDTIVEPDDKNKGAIYLGAQPVNWGGYSLQKIRKKIRKIHNDDSNHKITVFSILEDGELYDGPYIDEQGIDPAAIQKITDHNDDHHYDHHHLQLELKDYQAFSKKDHRGILETIKKMHQARQKGSVYIHCKSGMGRSMSVLLCYLTIYVFEGDIERAYDHIKEKRPIVSAKDSDHFKAAKRFCDAYEKQNRRNDYDVNKTDYNALYRIKKAAFDQCMMDEHDKNKNSSPCKVQSQKKYNKKLIAEVKETKKTLNKNITSRILSSQSSFCHNFFKPNNERTDTMIERFQKLTDLFPKMHNGKVKINKEQQVINEGNLANQRSNPDLLISSLKKYIKKIGAEINEIKHSDAIFRFTEFKECKKRAAEKMLDSLTTTTGRHAFTKLDIQCLTEGRLGEIITYHHQSLPINYIYSKHHSSSTDIAMNHLMR